MREGGADINISASVMSHLASQRPRRSWRPDPATRVLRAAECESWSGPGLAQGFSTRRAAADPWVCGFMQPSPAPLKKEREKTQRSNWSGGQRTLRQTDSISRFLTTPLRVRVSSITLVVHPAGRKPGKTAPGTSCGACLLRYSVHHVSHPLPMEGTPRTLLALTASNEAPP